jgi:hypothetical protein
VKKMVIVFFPLLISMIFYVTSPILAFDYCGSVKNWIGAFQFSGAKYYKGGAFDCVTYGAIVCIVVLIIPYATFIYRNIDIHKIKNAGNPININQIFLASVFFFSVYIAAFLAQENSYSSRGRSFVDLIFSQHLLIYMFFVFPCQILVGLWAVCLKLKLNRSKK